jgi:hypothetical protein
LRKHSAEERISGDCINILQQQSVFRLSFSRH